MFIVMREDTFRPHSAARGSEEPAVFAAFRQTVDPSFRWDDNS
jgi:hypothetical protein